AFTFAVVLTLAIGIGANSAIFTLIDALLLRALPVPHADQLVTIGNPAAVTSRWTGSPTTDFVSYPLYADIRSGSNSVLAGLYANGSAGDLDVIIGGDDQAVEHPNARLVSGNFFSVLEVGAYAGRTFTADQDRTPGQDPVAVISHDYWRRRFGGVRSAVESTLRVNGVPI